MPDINVFAILVAAVVVLVLGSTYYVVFAAKWAQLSGAGARESRPKPWKLAVELVRGLILAAVVAGLASQGKISDAGGGLLLGAALWIGFQVRALDRRDDVGEHALEAHVVRHGVRGWPLRALRRMRAGRPCSRRAEPALQVRRGGRRTMLRSSWLMTSVSGWVPRGSVRRVSPVSSRVLRLDRTCGPAG